MYRNQEKIQFGIKNDEAIDVELVFAVAVAVVVAVAVNDSPSSLTSRPPDRQRYFGYSTKPQLQSNCDISSIQHLQVLFD